MHDHRGCLWAMYAKVGPNLWNINEMKKHFLFPSANCLTKTADKLRSQSFSLIESCNLLPLFPPIFATVFFYLFLQPMHSTISRRVPFQRWKLVAHTHIRPPFAVCTRNYNEHCIHMRRLGGECDSESFTSGKLFMHYKTCISSCHLKNELPKWVIVCSALKKYNAWLEESDERNCREANKNNVICIMIHFPFN